MEGVITGAFYDKAQRRYEQRVDDGNMSFLSPEMRPPVGSAAWGNLLRGQINDFVAKLMGKTMGDQASWPAGQVARQIAGDHMQAQLQTELQQMLFGGWMGSFNDMGTPYGALEGLVGLLKSESQWQNQLRFGVQQEAGWA